MIYIYDNTSGGDTWMPSISHSSTIKDNLFISALVRMWQNDFSCWVRIPGEDWRLNDVRKTHTKRSRTATIPCNTPWKINVEPTNHPFRKENDLPNLHDYVPCQSSAVYVIFIQKIFLAIQARNFCLSSVFGQLDFHYIEVTARWVWLQCVPFFTGSWLTKKRPAFLQELRVGSSIMMSCKHADTITKKAMYWAETQHFGVEWRWNDTECLRKTKNLYVIYQFSGRVVGWKADGPAKWFVSHQEAARWYSSKLQSYIWANSSDLIRPHPKWWLSKGNPLISGKPTGRLVNYFNLARYIIQWLTWQLFASLVCDIFHAKNSLDYVTCLKLTAILPLKICRAPKSKRSYSKHHFWGAMLVSGRVSALHFPLIFVVFVVHWFLLWETLWMPCLNKKWMDKRFYNQKHP